MTTPLKPSSPSARSSSATAAGGSPIGSAASPKNRVGWRRIACARNAFDSRAISFRLLGLELLDAGRCQRKRLHVDLRRVHRRDPAVADIGKLSDQRRQPAPGPLRPLLEVAVRTVEKRRRGEVLFEGDGAHGAPHAGGVLDR